MSLVSESYSSFASFVSNLSRFVIRRHGTVASALSVSLDKLSVVVVKVILEQVQLGGALHRDLLGLEELVDPTRPPNGGEGVDSIASCVHFCVKGSVGSARPA